MKVRLIKIDMIDSNVPIEEIGAYDSWYEANKEAQKLNFGTEKYHYKAMLTDNIIKKDLLSIDRGIICHQVNCQKKMGSGLALAIKNKWPKVFAEYVSKEKWSLGDCQLVKVDEELYVANLAGQYFYGTDMRYTDYDGLEKAIKTLRSEASKLNLPVYFPFKIGCNLGGGDWDIVSFMIRTRFPDAFICQKDM